MHGPARARDGPLAVVQRRCAKKGNTHTHTHTSSSSQSVVLKRVSRALFVHRARRAWRAGGRGEGQGGRGDAAPTLCAFLASWSLSCPKSASSSLAVANMPLSGNTAGATRRGGTASKHCLRGQGQMRVLLRGRGRRACICWLELCDNTAPCFKNMNINGCGRSGQCSLCVLQVSSTRRYHHIMAHRASSRSRRSSWRWPAAPWPPPG